ncbi:MAG TPA: glycosyltransferase [Allosphingosinicella sp.]|nr:glycosyltransferase [Allosphingosinicella sp.]
MLIEAQPIADDVGEGRGESYLPTVSVLMPVRNCALFLDEALASLAGQTFTDFEIVVVDNGSTDATRDILRAWAKKEKRLRAFRLRRPGLARSLNFAASRARAPLLARLDGDDIAAPGRLAAQVEAMRARPGLGLLGSGAELIDSRGLPIGAIDRPTSDPDLRKFLRTGCAFVHSSVIMRREIFLAAGGYRKGLNVAEDYDLWLRMAEHSEIANLPDRLVRYRVHVGSATARRPVRQAVAIACVTAAAEARRLGRPEPFFRGIPELRKALPLLGITPRIFRRNLRLNALRLIVLHHYLALPLPAGLKARIRGAAIRIGLRPLYVLGLRSILAGARFRS